MKHIYNFLLFLLATSLSAQDYQLSVVKSGSPAKMEVFLTPLTATAPLSGTLYDLTYNWYSCSSRCNIP
jgi:hypothetical protein